MDGVNGALFNATPKEERRGEDGRGRGRESWTFFALPNFRGLVPQKVVRKLSCLPRGKL